MISKAKAIPLLGIGISAESEKELAARLGRRLSSRERTIVFTPNPTMLTRGARDPSFAATLKKADIRLPDGFGVCLGARLFGHGRLERVAGIDMGMRMLALASRQGYRVYFLGGKKGVAEKAAAHLKRRFPSLVICGTQDGYFTDEGKTLEAIRAASPDILYVCLGSPVQEQFIARNALSLPSVSLFMGLGGSLDVWSGNKSRAPYLMQVSGLEWLWRMAHEPKRVREIPMIAHFFVLLAAEKGRELVKLHSINDNFLDI